MSLTKTNIFRKILYQREVFTTSGFILLCLLLLILFPTRNQFEEFFSALAFLVLMPLLYIRLILKKRLLAFGFAVGDWKKGLIWGATSLIIGLLIIYIFIKYQNLAKNYYLPIYIYRFHFFLLHELFLIGFFVAVYEFFFRGFIQFSFTKNLNLSAVLLQTTVFFLIFAVTGNLDWSIFPYVLFAPLAGLIAYQSRSLIYSLAASWLFIVLTDVLIIATHKNLL